VKLIDIFEEIDVNGDGDLEWDEFTLFCIDDAVAATRREATKVPRLRVKHHVCWALPLRLSSRSVRPAAGCSLNWIPILRINIQSVVESRLSNVLPSRSSTLWA
jgi:hypothetical protein